MISPYYTLQRSRHLVRDNKSTRVPLPEDIIPTT